MVAPRRCGVAAEYGPPAVAYSCHLTCLVTIYVSTKLRSARGYINRECKRLIVELVCKTEKHEKEKERKREREVDRCR